MKLRRVILGKGLTVNLGDWNNVKPNITLEAEIEDGESYEEVRQHLITLVDQHLTEEIEKHDDSED